MKTERANQMNRKNQKKRYSTEFERLYDTALIFTKFTFRKRLLPLTDAEDVAMEAAEKVLRANERKAFSSAKNREHRWEMQKNMMEQLVRNAARARRSQKALVSINNFDYHMSEKHRYDQDGADTEVEKAMLVRKERMESDGGSGAERTRGFECDGKDPLWLVHFRFVENQLRHTDTPEARDAIEELKHLRKNLGLSNRKSKKMKPERRLAARETLRKAFRVAQYFYHQELARKVVAG